MSGGARRIGVFGGTFDPIHRGHLDTAEAAHVALQLDEVLIVPTRVSPHRYLQPHASAYHRFAMVALAVAGREGMLASDLELRRPGPSYTSSTLEHLASWGHAPSQLFFIAGADAFAEIATWKDYPALLDRSHFAIVSRPGHPAPRLRERLPELSPRMVDVPLAAGRAPAARPSSTTGGSALILLIDAQTADVSATRVRDAVAAGTSIASLVTPEVAGHIRRHGLYARGQGIGVRD